MIDEKRVRVLQWEHHDANSDYKGCVKFLTMKGNTQKDANAIIKRYSKEKLDFPTKDLLAVATKIQTDFSSFVQWYKSETIYPQDKIK